MGLKRHLTTVFEASEAENREAILRIVRAGPPGRRLLDLGCHDGAFTVSLQRAARASEAHGVELLEHHAATARDRGVRVAVGDLNEPLPLPDGHFDLVHANQVIEHLRSTDGFLREAARVAAPGGRVILSTNNLSSWHNLFSLLLGLQPFPSHVSDEVHVGNPLNPRDGAPHEDPGQTHLRIFTARALRELAEHHGLRAERLAVSGYYPLPPRLARPLAALDPRHAAFLIGVFRPDGG